MVAQNIQPVPKEDTKMRGEEGGCRITNSLKHTGLGLPGQIAITYVSSNLIG
jgi:hypothetical protein